MSLEIEKIKSFKLKLCNKLTIALPVELKNNPISKIIKLDEIKELSDYSNFLKFVYFHKNTIHNILYEEEEIIYIKDINDNDLCSYIYLNFLIDDNTNVVNYQYPFELIRKINNMQTKEDKKNNIKVILLAKIILNLTKNFEEIDESAQNTTKNEKELNDIKNYNIGLINNNKDLLKEYEPFENDITQMTLEEFYCLIIKNLIIKDKINESNETNKIIKVFEFKSFNITKKILDELKILLNEEEEYIKKYKINKFDDIFNKEKIIFYYVLLYYIIKNNIYIYEIPFLDKTRKNILKYLKKDIEKLNESLKKDKDNKHKIEFILEFFTNGLKCYSDLCIKKQREIMNRSLNSNSSSIMGSSLNNQNNQFINNNNYDDENSSSKSFFGDSYKNEKQHSGRSIDPIDEPQKDEYTILKEKYSNEDIFNILDNSSFTFHTNRKGSSPLIIYDEIIFGNRTITIDEVKRLTSNDGIIMNNYKKLLSILEEIKNRIESEFNFKFKITVTLNFKTNFVYNSLFNIKCNYTLKIPYENNKEYADDHIFSNGLSAGFPYLINEIKSDIYSDLNYEE